MESKLTDKVGHDMECRGVYADQQDLPGFLYAYELRGE